MTPRRQVTRRRRAESDPGRTGHCAYTAGAPEVCCRRRESSGRRGGTEAAGAASPAVLASTGVGARRCSSSECVCTAAGGGPGAPAAPPKDEGWALGAALQWLGLAWRAAASLAPPSPDGSESNHPRTAMLRRLVAAPLS